MNDIKLTLDAARVNMNIDPGVVPDIKAFLNVMLPQPFLAQLLEAMNRGGPACAVQH